MKSFWFAGKVALLFVLLLLLSLGGAFILFLRVAAPELMEEIGRLRAGEAVTLAQHLEEVLDQLPTPAASELENPALRELLEREGSQRDLRLFVGPEVEPPPDPPILSPWHQRFQPRTFTVSGRKIRQLGAPGFDLWVPLYRGEQAIGHLRVRGPSHGARVHLAFERGLTRIAFLALLSVLVLTVVLTAPLRRMSRSMDRIAAGELGHRVSARGRDEVAAMGRSFNAMADRIEEMVTGQKEMLAGVSHELRSPLARMKMTVELLRIKDAAPENRLEALEEEIDHLDALVGEILTTTRLDLGTAPLRREVVELGAVIETAWQKCLALQRQKLQRQEMQGERSRLNDLIDFSLDLNLDLNLDRDAQRVDADPELVQRIFGNLLANATRYARSRIRVTGERRGDRIDIEVADDGEGVASDQLDKLFEPFYRVDAARSHGRNVGLGLAIVRRAVEAHDGHVEARRSDLGGLAVVFDLPSVPAGR